MGRILLRDLAQLLSIIVGVAALRVPERLIMELLANMDRSSVVAS